MNEEAAKETYKAIRTYREERDAWIKAYHELSEKSQEFAVSQRKRLGDLQKQIEDERSDWRKMVRKARAPGFGVFAGAGYSNGDLELVFGAGIVWRLF